MLFSEGWIASAVFTSFIRELATHPALPFETVLSVPKAPRRNFCHSSLRRGQHPWQKFVFMVFPPKALFPLGERPGPSPQFTRVNDLFCFLKSLPLLTFPFAVSNDFRMILLSGSGMNSFPGPFFFSFHSFRRGG